MWFAIRSTIRWLAFRLDMICVAFVTFVVFLAIATQSGPGEESPAKYGVFNPCLKSLGRKEREQNCAK